MTRPSFLILLIGLPGSGKSTLARQLQAIAPAYVIISTDAIRQQLFGDEAIQGSWDLIWQEAQRQFRQAVCLREVVEPQQSEQVTVIYDATNVVRRDRRKLLKSLRAIGFRHITGIWLDTPLELCLMRNQSRRRQVPEAVIQRMYRRLAGAPPSLSDGLAGLIRYSTAEIAAEITIPADSTKDCGLNRI